MAKASCRARVAAVRWLAPPDVLEVDLAMEEPPELAFTAGQWVAVPLDDKTVRPYSMASPPSEGRTIRLAVDVKPGGPGSRYFRALRVGDPVRFQPPLGTLTPIPGSAAPLLLVAEEIGVVPFRSIVLTEAERGFPRPVTLILVAATRPHLLYHDELAGLAARAPGFRFRPRLVVPEPGWPGEVGPALPALAEELTGGPGPDVLLCGGAAVVRAAREACLARGVERRRIRYERFW